MRQTQRLPQVQTRRVDNGLKKILNVYQLRSVPEKLIRHQNVSPRNLMSPLYPNERSSINSSPVNMSLIEDSLHSVSPCKKQQWEGRFTPQSLLNQFRMANRLVRHNKTSSLLYRKTKPVLPNSYENTAPLT